jgi:hypothetical protein
MALAIASHSSDIFAEMRSPHIIEMAHNFCKNLEQLAQFL